MSDRILGIGTNSDVQHLNCFVVFAEFAQNNAEIILGRGVVGRFLKRFSVRAFRFGVVAFAEIIVAIDYMLGRCFELPVLPGEHRLRTSISALA
jgi:hypothetical protein